MKSEDRLMAIHMITNAATAIVSSVVIGLVCHKLKSAWPLLGFLLVPRGTSFSVKPIKKGEENDSERVSME